MDTQREGNPLQRVSNWEVEGKSEGVLKEPVADGMEEKDPTPFQSKRKK